jgi:hypothetical protein
MGGQFRMAYFSSNPFVLVFSSSEIFIASACEMISKWADDYQKNIEIVQMNFS